ncbi:MAG: aspartokinase/homoserine dehydrogenase [Gemmatimonadetes bacterium]|nr:aspartokinase/homoserine dehydrogenase [Gemmatimonadota bacterium]
MPSQQSVVVHKFGGAALASAVAIERIVQLLGPTTAGDRRVVVTSALLGVTDQLLDALGRAVDDDLPGMQLLVRELRDRHLDVASTLCSQPVHGAADHGGTCLVARDAIVASFEELEALLHTVPAGHPAAPAVRDHVVARGERLAARLFALALARAGIAQRVVDGTELIHTDGRAGDAAPDLDATEPIARTRLAPLLDDGVLVIVPGFIGAGHAGEVVTLGRGGSDLSAAVLGRALDADEVVLWKDVPGCMTADPRIVPDARVVPMLDAREASELAYYGAKVLHPRTLVPLRNGMRLRIRPFADANGAGTTIVVGRAVGGSPVRAVSAMADQALVTVSGNGMLGVPGIAARMFGALAAAGVSVSMISQASSEHSICCTVPMRNAGDAVARLREAFAYEIEREQIEGIEYTATLATIAVVGSGMAHTPGIAARIFGAVATAGVNIVAIAQGASERNISFVVDGDAAPAALRAIHDVFQLGKVGGGRVARREAPIDLVLLGMGRIGRALVGQIGALSRTGRPALRIVAVIDRSGYLFDPRGLSERRLDALTRAKESGSPVSQTARGAAASAEAAVEFIASHVLSRPVLVDVASGDTADALLAAARHGMSLVLANKVPLAGPLEVSRRILDAVRSRGGRVLHEATVGAGLPVIDTIQQLVLSGDRVDTVDSSPSGTMGFLFSEMGRGRSFSDAVRTAMSLGYTEPDPRDDLGGTDVARKGLILARMLGYAGELSDVGVESLVPEGLKDLTRDEFLAALPSCDGHWVQRVSEAEARGEVLRYRARSTRGGVRVGLVSVPKTSALASLDGTDNLFAFRTARYHDRPLIVSGPGAGAAVTAAGVLGDVLRIVAA